MTSVVCFLTYLLPPHLLVKDSTRRARTRGFSLELLLACWDAVRSVQHDTAKRKTRPSFSRRLFSVVCGLVGAV